MNNIQTTEENFIRRLIIVFCAATHGLCAMAVPTLNSCNLLKTHAYPSSFAPGIWEQTGKLPRRRFRFIRRRGRLAVASLLQAVETHNMMRLPEAYRQIEVIT
jgi:hypothetical protein